MRLRTNKSPKAGKQQGAVAIEFAALFLVLFLTLYAIIAYSLPILLELSFQHTSAQAGRAIYKVDPALPLTDYEAVLSDEVNKIIGNSWLPPKWRQGGCPLADTEQSYRWQPLRHADNGASYGYIAFDDSDPDDSRFILHICLQRGYNKQGPEFQRAILPVFNFLGVDIPSLPKNEQGDTFLRGQTLTRL